MIDGALSALSQGGTKEVPLIDGRMVSVHASPAKGTSEKMAMGVSALPHPGDMYMQSKEIIKIIVTALAELGGKPEDIIRTRVFLTDISQWEAAGRAHGEAFAHMDVPPASAFYGVNELLHPDMLIEVEAMAIIDSEF